MAEKTAADELALKQHPLIQRSINKYVLLFHKTSAAVEVVIFIAARKMVNPSIAALDLLLGAAALAGLIIVRFYYLRDEPDQGRTPRVSKGR